MKKIILIPLLVTMLIACGRKKENTENAALTIYEEAMKLHNEVMPHIDEMYQLEGKLNALRDSLVEDSTGNAQRIVTIDEKLSSLKTASKDMMDWMHNIQDVPAVQSASGHEHHSGHGNKSGSEQAEPEETLHIQQQQKRRIEEIKVVVERSIEEAKQELAN